VNEQATNGSPSILSSSERILEASRYAIAIPVAVLLLAALGAFVYGVVFFIDATRKIVNNPFPIAKNIGLFVVLIDLFLVGATLMIAGVGLYELFVSPEREEHRTRILPTWLVMRDLNDLKGRVISMIVLVSAVSFTDSVVNFQTGRDVLNLGAGVALMILALTIFVRFGAKD
jgi:uncharacterized protein (TIGR00645 family)